MSSLSFAKSNEIIQSQDWDDSNSNSHPKYWNSRKQASIHTRNCGILWIINKLANVLLAESFTTFSVGHFSALRTPLRKSCKFDARRRTPTERSLRIPSRSETQERKDKTVPNSPSPINSPNRCLPTGLSELLIGLDAQHDEELLAQLSGCASCPRGCTLGATRTNAMNDSIKPNPEETARKQ